MTLDWWKLNLEYNYESSSTYRRIYNADNMGSFFALLENEMRGDVTNCGRDINLKYDIFYNLLYYYFDTNFPLK